MWTTPRRVNRSAHAVIAASFTFSLLFAIVIAGILCATAAAARVFSPETFMLANGMQVVVISNHRVPVVSHMVWYKVGAADEPPGHSGIAHLLEHLMFKGTPTHPQGEFSRIVARHGGKENAFTSHDFTAYFQNIAKDRLELVMQMEADRMRNLVLSKEQVEPEKLVVLEERRQRTENDPAALLGEQSDAVLYLNHPYRRPVIGWAPEIAALTTEDVLNFYKQWYVPNNAVLIVAGDVTASEVRPLAERIYGAIPAGSVPPRLNLLEPTPIGERRVTLADERVRQPAWQRMFLAPSYKTGETADADSLQVFTEIIGGGPTSRLYQALVVRDKLAVTASAGYDAGRRGPSRLILAVEPKPGVSMQQIEDAVAAQLAELLENGVTTEEVERAKQRMVASAVYARDSLSTGAYALGAALAIGQTVDDVESWPDRIRAVDKARVDSAARRVLEGAGFVTSQLEPRNRKEAALQ